MTSPSMTTVAFDITDDRSTPPKTTRVSTEITDTRSSASKPVAAPLAETLTLKLRKPVPALGSDGEILALELREPRAGEMLRWSDLSGIEANIAAVSVVSGLPPSTIGKLAARDIIAASAFINSFGLVSIDLPEELPVEMVIDLHYPIDHAGQTYRQLRLVEPAADQLIEWDKADGIVADLKIISAVSGVPEIALHKLGARDLVNAGSYLANFLVPGLPAGDR